MRGSAIDAAGEVFALLGGGLGADEHAVAAGLADGLDDELLEVGKDVLALFGTRHEEGFDVFEDGFFREVVLDDVGDVGVESLVVGDAGAEGVGEGDVAGAVRIEEAGDAEDGVAAEGEGVDEVVVDAAIDDVDSPQAGGRPHIDDVVVGDEVAAFDELDAHLAGEVGVLEVGGVEDAGGEKDDVGLRAAFGGERAETAEQELSVLLDGADVIGAEEMGGRCASSRGGW